MSKHILPIFAAVALAFAAGAAHAQWPSYGTSQTFGNQTFYNGSVNGQPYNGNQQTFGNQTFSHFYSGGQSTNCNTMRFGSMTTTNCY